MRLPDFLRCPAGRQGQAPHGVIDVRGRRPDLSPDRFHGGIEAACAPSASADGCLHEHDHGPLEHPDRRVCDRGDCRSSFRVASIEGNHRMGSRPGAEEHRSSALPVAIARHGDFAPTSITSRCLLSRPPLSRPVRSDVGREGYRRRAACLHGAPQRGPCGDELPRRNPTFTSPRHLPSRDRSRTNEGFLRGSKLPWSCADTFFTAGEPGGGTPNSDPDSSANRPRAGEPATSSKDRSAPRDFCVRVEDRGQMCRRTSTHEDAPDRPLFAREKTGNLKENCPQRSPQLSAWRARFRRRPGGGADFACAFAGVRDRV